MDVIIAALIAAVPASIAAIAAWRTRRSVGKPNGHGNLMEIGAKLIAWQARHEEQDRQNFQAIADHLNIELPVGAYSGGDERTSL